MTQAQAKATGAVSCLAPVSADRITTVVLGSMPGVASLEAGQYYAHPRNAFWPLVAEVFGFDPGLPYKARCRALAERGVGLWDTIASCQRPGSLDSDIVKESVVANDIASWLSSQPVRVIGLNGATAASLFDRHCPDAFRARIKSERIGVLRLPSSSPANAKLGFDAKLAAWRGLAQGQG